jgi:hypothetical protein
MKTLGNIKNEDAVDLQKAVAKYFSDPDASCDDDDVHALAESLGVEPDEVEEICYQMLHCLFSGGESKGKKDKVDPDQLKMGLVIESEHSDNMFINEKISRDHLTEDPEYYTHLKEMEEKY